MFTKTKNPLSIMLSLLMLLSVFGGARFTASAAYSAGDTIQFGSYPQTQVTDETLIAALDAVPKSWASYKYYYGTANGNTSGVGTSTCGTMRPDDFMRFADFTYGGDRYRAVIAYYFRPILTTNYFSGGAGWQYQNGFLLNTVYYFKYEPLTWRVLDPATGYIVCENVIDAQEFQKSVYYNNSYYADEASSVIANLYKASSLRVWLNDDFFNTAFNASQKAKVQQFVYDTAAGADSVSLLTDAQAQSSGFFASDAARMAKATDYARSQGCDVTEEGSYAAWWLRTATSVTYKDYAVPQDGVFNASSSQFVCCATSVGVRPACRLTQLGNDTSAGAQPYSVQKHAQQGHSYEAHWTWADDYGSAAAAVTCGVCFNVHETLTDTAPVLTAKSATASVQIGGVTLTDTFNTVLLQGDTFRYGTYPKTRVKDPVLQQALEAVDKTFVSYGYYAGTQTPSTGSSGMAAGTVGDWMKFADFFYNGAKYRAVKIEKYRPHAAQQRNPVVPGEQQFAHQFLSGYVAGETNTYYFLYEPLTWRVLDADTGLVICEDIVDCQPYQATVKSNTSGYWQAQYPVGQHYANSYATSTLHDWLNGHFYETAFTAAQKENVKVTAVNNTAYNTTYSSATTQDKVFLLSYNEAINPAYGFDAVYNNSDELRGGFGTDYAYSQGLESYGSSGSVVNSHWLRSPSEAHAGYSAFRVYQKGAILGGSWVTDGYSGVRPVCCLNVLKYDETVSSNLQSAPHQFTLTSAGDTFTATCVKPDCDLTVTLKLNAPEKNVYGDGKSAAATLTGLADFNDTLGFAVSENNIAYYSGGTLLSAAPTGAGNYTASLTLTFDGVSYTAAADYTISRKNLIVTADAKSKTYGEADPELTYTVEGLVEGDALEGALARTGDDNVGVYAITQGTLTASDNYAVSFTGASFTIGAKTLSITADAKSKTYGEADPELTYTVEGLVEGDALTGALTRTGNDNVGVYAITQGTLTAGDNYAVSFTGADFIIEKKALTVTADAKTKVYGDADPALTYTAEGLAEGDTLSGALTRTGDNNVGVYEITLGTLTAGDNYDLTFTGADFTIGKKAITVTADAKTKVYGDADPALTYTAEGLVAGDALTGKLSRAPGNNAGTYAVTQGTLTAGDNYDLTFTGADFTIIKRALTVTADAKSKEQGAADPALTYSVTGLQYNDTVTVTLSRAPGEEPGSYAITAVINADDNYEVTYTGATLTVRAPQEYGECPYCGEIHNEKTFVGFFTRFIHLLLYVIKRINFHMFDYM